MSKIKLYINKIKELFVLDFLKSHYRLVIWTEFFNNKLRVELVYINNEFEKNKYFIGYYEDYELNDENIFFNIINFAKKYKVVELVETNYILNSKEIKQKFFITKTNKLLYSK